MRRGCDPVLFGRLGARHCPKRIPRAGMAHAREPMLTQVAKRETIMKITLSRSSSFLLVLATLACIGLPIFGQDISFLTNGLVGHWSFDEGQGTTAHDSSGHGNDGVIHSGASWAVGKIGNALHFNGNSDSFVQVPSSASLNVSTGLTICAWIKSENTDGARDMVAKWNDNTSEWSYIFKDWNSSDTLSIELSKGGHADLASLQGNRSIVVEEWMHAATTFDAATGQVRLYLNGELDAQSTSSGGEIHSSLADLLIGSSRCLPDGGICEGFAGLIDEVRIYSRGLSDTEVLTLYNYEKSLTLTNVAPVILSQPAGTNLYVGDTAQLTVAANGTWPLAYLWRKDGVPLDGRTTTMLTLTNASPTDIGDYTVVVTNAFGSVTSTVARVNVAVRPSELFVSLDILNPAWPYTTWSTAATNIQDAVDTAAAGAEIVVSNGVYSVGARDVGDGPSRVVITNAITLRSVNGPQFTVIDGGGTVRCVHLASGSALSGFTLTSGSASPGGGVYCSANSAITNCVIANCMAYSWVPGPAPIVRPTGVGGGVCGGVLYGCTLTGNSANLAGGGAYGSTLYDCMLTGNSAHWGGGASGCTLYDCTLTDNYPGNSPGWNGGVVSGSAVYDCTLTGNWGGSDGAFYKCIVVENQGGISGTAYNCLIADNLSGSDGTFYNCTVVANEGGISGSAFNSVVYYNWGGNYAEGTTLNYCCTTPLPTNGIGNITGPPLFMDMDAGDYRLWEGSPCIDAGTNLMGFTMLATNVDTGEIYVAASYTYEPTDILGNTRFIDGNGDGKVAWDIGAYEFDSFKPPRFTAQPQFTTNGWNLNFTGPTNKWVRVQRSGNLKDWEDIWFGFMGAEGVQQVIDGDTGQKQMFYRAVVP
jgi:hypothetical protein